MRMFAFMNKLLSEKNLKQLFKRIQKKHLFIKKIYVKVLFYHQYKREKICIFIIT